MRKRQNKSGKYNSVTDKTQSKQRRNRLLLLLAFIVASVFYPVIYFDFVNIDDDVLIINNPLIIDSSISYLNCFTKNLYNVHYKPLVFLSWKAEFQLLGGQPSHFHIGNWLLHIGNALILFLITSLIFKEKLLGRNQACLMAFGVSLLFAINPLRIESVAWASQRKDMMFAFFFLLSWFSYLHYIKTKKAVFVLMGALLYLCSGLSKSMGLPLIAILFLSDYIFDRKWSVKLVLEKIPYFVTFVILAFLYGLLGKWGQTDIIQEISFQPSFSQGYLDKLAPIAQWPVSATLRFYLWILHCLIPIKLSVVYPYDKIFSFFGKGLYVFPLLFFGLFIWLWKKRIKKPHIFIGLLFFVITLSPALALDTAGNGIFLADRYTYIPSIGIFIIMVSMLNTLENNIRNAFYAFICITYILLTLSNIGHWRNSETLFSQAVNIDPESSLGNLNLGNYYLDKKEFDQALKYFNRGIKYNPGYVKLYVNRARIYLEQNRMDLALNDLNTCLSLTPDLVEALINRGIALGMKGDFSKALIDLNRAVALRPNNASALLNRGIIHFQIKNYQRSINDHQNYLRISPNDENAINTIGICHNALGQYDQAITQFTAAIKINPAIGEFYYNRSLAYYGKGFKPHALQDALQAQKLGAVIPPNYVNSLR